jgi:hypothetical protein
LPQGGRARGVRWNCAYWSGAEDVGGPPRAARRLGWNDGAYRQARLSLADSRSRPHRAHHPRPTHRYATKAKHGSNQGSAIEPPPVLAHPSAPSPSFRESPCLIRQRGAPWLHPAHPPTIPRRQMPKCTTWLPASRRHGQQPHRHGRRVVMTAAESF